MGVQQLQGGAPLQDVAGCSRAKGPGDVSGVRVHRQKDQPGVRCGVAQPAGGFHAIQQGHGDIEQDDIRLQLFRGRQQGPAVFHRSHYLALGFQNLPKPLHDQRVVIRKQDARPFHGSILFVRGDSNINLCPVPWLRVDRNGPVHKPYPFPNAYDAKPGLVRQQAGIEPLSVIRNR